MQTENINGLLVDHAEPVGEAGPAPILFVHGLWDASWLFSNWLPRAAERGWDAWAVNLRGREGSRPVSDLGKVGLGDFVADVREVIRYTGPAVVVGYSMGGLVVQVASALDPNVRAAVYACSIPPRGIVALSGRVLRHSVRYLPAMLAGKTFQPNRADADAVIFNRLRPEERDRWFPRMLADSGRVARQIALEAIKVDGDKVRCPTLVVSAVDDYISPRKIQPKLVAKYRAEHIGFPGRAHMLPLEDGWEQAIDAVLDWAGSAVGA